MSLKEVITRRRFVVVFFLVTLSILIPVLLSRVQIILKLDTDVLIADKLSILVNEKLNVPIK